MKDEKIHKAQVIKGIQYKPRSEKQLVIALHCGLTAVNGNHDKSVDIWSIGHLVLETSVKSKLLIEYAERNLMIKDYKKRPTAKEALEWLCSRYKDILPAEFFIIYYVPYAKNFAAIDSIQLFNNGPDHLYQSTVSNHHNVKNSVGSVIRLNKQIDFYFVVPKDVFPRFKYNQKFLNGEGKPYRNQPEWMRNITQFALEIDWDAYIALGENDE
ncbi:15573_t:CDS:2 [Entrophospora sp. SA101]|nr:15573_t:CDS:2 [Entrophospora sp. SA101]